MARTGGKSLHNEEIIQVVQDPVESAKEANLHYTYDTTPGIIRKRAGKGFHYIDAHGNAVKDKETIVRIKSLGVPPAWEHVWICSDPRGHLQATGRDAKGRKQYRYHPKWREVRDATKYDRMIAFGHALPLIRKRTEEDLKLPGLPREKVLATVVQLLEKTLIRVGNDEYAKENNSYGLTTMRDKHVEVSGEEISFEFKGKSGVKHLITVEDKQLAKIVKKCQDLPGYELFQYIDENGEKRDVTSSDVNTYLKEITGESFTAKDFRTWHGTILAAEALQEFAEFRTKTEAKKNVVRAVEAVAAQLGNTKAICRKCYIHPLVIDTYLAGKLHEDLQNLSKKLDKLLDKNLSELKPEEAATVVFLQQGVEIAQ